MKQTINYLDIDRQEYLMYYVREEVNERLEGKQIINIETLENIIRVWYKEN